MGNYPFASNYIAGTMNKPMPPYPVQHACSFLDKASSSDATLLLNVRKAVSVLYNVSADVPCFELPAYPTRTL